MSPQVISLDAADTLLEIFWHPIQFPLRMVRKHLGWTIDEQVAGEAYSRLYQGSQLEYEHIHAGGETACFAFWDDLTERWLRAISPGEVTLPEIEAFVAASWADFFDAGSGLFRLFDDVVPFLDACSRRGVRLVVVSNWDFTLRRLLEAYGVGHYFERVFASSLCGFHKPDERLFRAVELDLGVPGPQILHIGDSPVNDYRAATDSGWRALLLDRGAAVTRGERIRSLMDVLGHIGE